jgi:hypothetical protein
VNRQRPPMTNVLGLALVLSSCMATAQERIAVPDARPLLLAAIDAPDGRAHGLLSGPMADAITARFKATSPVYIDVSTERRYAQRGCRRMKVSFWQDGVQLPGEPSPRRRTIDFGINYCRDGLPPRSLF